MREYALRYPFDGAITDETYNLSEAREALDWAIESEAHFRSVGEHEEADKYVGAEIVYREAGNFKYWEAL